MWTRHEVKQRGREAFKLNYWRCVLVAFIFAIVTGGCSGGSSYRASNTNPSSGSPIETVLPEEAEEALSSPDQITDVLSENKVLIVIFILVFLVIFIIVAVIGFVIKAFLLNPIEVGCRNFFIDNLNEPSMLSSLSRGFDVNYKNVVRIMFFRDLYLFLWALIPIAGIFIAIVKSYSYLMVPYIVAENPDIDKDEAFSFSINMMDGQKWRAFVLALSFIGWHILGVLTLFILELFYVMPYQQSTGAALYEKIDSIYNA